MLSHTVKQEIAGERGNANVAEINFLFNFRVWLQEARDKVGRCTKLRCCMSAQLQKVEMYAT